MDKKGQIGLIVILLVVVGVAWIITTYDYGPQISLTAGNVVKEIEELSNSFIEGLEDFEINGEEELRDETLIEQRIFELVNEERVRVGARPLVSNGKFNGLAKRHSNKMKQNNFFEHSTDNVGENIHEVPIHYAVVGCGPTFTNKAIANCMVSGWIDSPGHYTNMIDRGYGITGVGVSCDWSSCKGTQNFG